MGEAGEGDEREGGKGRRKERRRKERRRKEGKERRRKERRETGKTGRKTRRDLSLTAAVTRFGGWSYLHRGNPRRFSLNIPTKIVRLKLKKDQP